MWPVLGHPRLHEFLKSRHCSLSTLKVEVIAEGIVFDVMLSPAGRRLPDSRRRASMPTV
jgi:hypothetical protein